jgi:hypothetical protein
VKYPASAKLIFRSIFLGLQYAVDINFDFIADKNLASLEFQLQNHLLKKICDVMLMSQSSYIRQFLTLAEEIEVSI